MLNTTVFRNDDARRLHNDFALLKYKKMFRLPTGEPGKRYQRKRFQLHNDTTEPLRHQKHNVYVKGGSDKTQIAIGKHHNT